MKKIYAVLCFLVLSTGIVKSQTYAASNFTFISLTNPETGSNIYGDKYSACWGWYQTSTQKEYAIACSKSGTYWVDVTNPATPTVCAFAAGTSSNGVWRETKTYQNYCYVACDDNSSTGFQIFNMSSLPTTITPVYQGNSYFKRGHTLWVDGNKLYVAGVTYSNNTTSSMNVYSLATPTAPVLLRQLKQDYSFISYVHDMYVRNDTVYAHCGNQGMYVFKFNTGTNTFTQLGSLTSYTASGYNHSSWLTPNGQTLVFTDEVPSGLPIKTANVSNLSNIQVLATTNQFAQTTPHNPFGVSNNLCFMSSYQDGTQLYDISNPSNPTLLGFFDTFPQGGGNNNNWSGDDYDGQWGMYPYFPSKNIFALDQKNGIFMLKSHLYQNPSAAFTIPSSVCTGANLNIVNTSTSATSYTWTFAGGSPATSTLSNPTVSYAAPGVYTITLLSANQTTTTAFTTQTINVGGLSASATSTMASCGTCSNGILSAGVTGGTGPYSYTWSPIGNTTPTVSGVAPGCYTVQITDAMGCNGSATTCVSFATGLNSLSLDKAISVFPNPAHNQVTIESLNGAFSYSVYNQLGQLVISGNSAQQKTTINLNGVTKGAYTIEITEGANKIRKKLLVD